MKIRPLRGQVVIREEPVTASTIIWTPDARPRDVKTHVGRVLAMGPPARTPSGAEVDHGFRVGDLVQFHFTSLEVMAKNPWEDGKIATWVPQENVDAVWFEPDRTDRTGGGRRG